MFKYTATYKDYNNNERTEDFYFNLNEAEIAEMEWSTAGGLAEMMTNILKAKDTPAIVKIFKELVLRAYGEKDADGKHFRKSAEISTAFSQTEAYSQLFMKLATDDVFAADFVNHIIPPPRQAPTAPQATSPMTAIN